MNCKDQNSYETQITKTDRINLKFGYTNPENVELMGQIKICEDFCIDDQVQTKGKSNGYILCQSSNYLTLISLEEYSKIIAFISPDFKTSSTKVISAFRTILNIFMTDDRLSVVVSVILYNSEQIGRVVIPLKDIHSVIADKGYDIPHDKTFNLPEIEALYQEFYVIDSNKDLLSDTYNVFTLKYNYYIIRESIIDASGDYNFISIYSTIYYPGKDFISQNSIL